MSHSFNAVHKWKEGGSFVVRSGIVSDCVAIPFVLYYIVSRHTTVKGICVARFCLVDRVACEEPVKIQIAPRNRTACVVY